MQKESCLLLSVQVRKEGQQHIHTMPQRAILGISTVTWQSLPSPHSDALQGEKKVETFQVLSREVIKANAKSQGTRAHRLGKLQKTGELPECLVPEHTEGQV